MKLRIETIIEDIKKGVKRLKVLTERRNSVPDSIVVVIQSLNCGSPFPLLTQDLSGRLRKCSKLWKEEEGTTCCNRDQSEMLSTTKPHPLTIELSSANLRKESLPSDLNLKGGSYCSVLIAAGHLVSVIDNLVEILKV